MTFEEQLIGWVTWAGGISGLVIVAYMILMLWLNHRKDRKLEAIELRLAKIEGLLVGQGKEGKQ